MWLHFGRKYDILYGEMAKLRPEIRAELEATGKWADFRLFREGLVRKGVRAVDALREAVEKYCPEHLGDFRLSSRAEHAERRRGAQVVETATPILGEAKKVEAAVGEIEAVAKKVRGDGVEIPVVTAKTFKGKRFTAKDTMVTISWVVENFLVKDIKAEEAPNGVAWSLLTLCKGSLAFAEDFISKSFVKMIPTKPVEEESGDKDDFDGKLEYDILGRLLDGEGR